MALFGGSKTAADDAAQQRIDELNASIEELSTQLREKQAETDLEVRLEGKKQELLDAELEIKRVRAEHEAELQKKDEEHSRKMREIEHKVGLQQQKADQDQAAAVKEAELKVREANLETERTQLEQQIEFQREEMNKRSESIEGLLGQVMERLPKHTVHQFLGDKPSSEQAQLAAGSGDE